MQLLDPADPRRPNVKIAASIRAAILNGELAPGDRLPSNQELAKFFGTAPMTVQTAIRKLGEEGYVRSRSGSGVYVRDRVSMPVEQDQDHPDTGTAKFLFEMGQLKNLPRAGWLLLGIPQPESVAEHSFRVAATGITLAAMEGADIGRTAALALMHDAHETRIGDVPSVGRAYVTTAAPEAITGHQTATMPDEVAKVFQELTAEYEASDTLESRLAHDADKIETLLQAIEYAQRGHDTSAWRETSLAALRTDAGRELARAIGSTNPQWWSPFAASYHELRAESRGHAREGLVVDVMHAEPADDGQAD
jgi:putative hydrolases of HD superfamily